MTAVKHAKAAPVISQMERFLETYLIQYAEAALKAVQSQLQTLYDSTFDIGQNPETDKNFDVLEAVGRPHLSLDATSIKIEGGKISIALGVKVLRGDKSTYHNIWYYLSAGTDDVVFDSDSAVFSQRIPNRTSPGSLSLDAYVDSGEYGRIQAGSTRNGILPREWTLTIAKLLEVYVKTNPLAGVKGWEIKYTVDDDVELIPPY